MREIARRKSFEINRRLLRFERLEMRQCFCMLNVGIETRETRILCKRTEAVSVYELDIDLGKEGDDDDDDDDQEAKVTKCMLIEQ